MSNAVLDLQKEALKSDSDILELLRTTYLVARKLNLRALETWANSELNGYDTNSEIPSYRNLRGEIKAKNIYNNWVPYYFQNNNQQFSTYTCRDSISQLLDIYKNSKTGYFIYTFNPEVNIMLSKSIGFTTYFALFIGTNQISKIIESVKNHILSLAITLEENGILGEGLLFTDIEKEVAHKSQAIYQTINNFYGNVSETQIQQATTNSQQEK